MIWLSEKRDVFTQNFLDPIRRKFYIWRALISGGITRGSLAHGNPDDKGDGVHVF